MVHIDLDFTACTIPPKKSMRDLGVGQGSGRRELESCGPGLGPRKGFQRVEIPAARGQAPGSLSAQGEGGRFSPLAPRSLVDAAHTAIRPPFRGIRPPGSRESQPAFSTIDIGGENLRMPVNLPENVTTQVPPANIFHNASRGGTVRGPSHSIAMLQKCRKIWSIRT